MPEVGIIAIQNLLLVVNKNSNLISDSSKQKKQKQAHFQPQTGAVDGAMENSQSYSKNENDFLVRIAPAKIRGINVLWKIILEAKDERVSLKAMELLSELYTKLGEELEDNLAEISVQFVETAIDKLYIFYQKMTKENENRSKEIVTLLKVIQDMLDESERKGNYCITPFNSMYKGYPLRINVINHANESQGKLHPDKFTLSIHSRATVWQLKTLIGGQLEIPPENVFFF